MVLDEDIIAIGRNDSSMIITTITIISNNTGLNGLLIS